MTTSDDQTSKPVVEQKDQKVKKSFLVYVEDVLTAIILGLFIKVPSALFKGIVITIKVLFIKVPTALIKALISLSFQGWVNLLTMIFFVVVTFKGHPFAGNMISLFWVVGIFAIMFGIICAFAYVSEASDKSIRFYGRATRAFFYLALLMSFILCF